LRPTWKLIPLTLKPVLALAGQTVCRVGPVITVDGRELGAARENDHSGRPLPIWQGCRVIGRGEVFLMNPDEPASLDGRYFGPISIAAIVGDASPLWTSADDPSCGFLPAQLPSAALTAGAQTTLCPIRECHSDCPSPPLSR